MSPLAQHGPMIVFRRLVPGSPAFDSWRDQRDRALSARTQLERAPADSPRARHAVAPSWDAVGDPPDEPLIVWRLVSLSGREIGASAGWFESFDLAQQGAREVVALAEQAHRSGLLDVAHDRFGWLLDDAGSPLLVGTDWYRSWRDRDHALQAGVRALARAQVDISVDAPAAPARGVHPLPAWTIDAQEIVETGIRRPIRERRDGRRPARP